MPTQHTVTSYKFDELSDSAKEKARDRFREGALDYDWWESTYEDAENVGLKITGFDLGRSQRVDGHFVKSDLAVAHAILNDHGKTCDTYVLAEAFLNRVDGDITDEQSEEFLRDLRGAYWSILNSEAEYLTSNESVEEGIRANEYDFTINGKLF